MTPEWRLGAGGGECGDLRPQIPPAGTEPDPIRPGGRGLTLVTALADRWDCVPYPPSGNTVRAELLDANAQFRLDGSDREDGAAGTGPQCDQLTQTP